MMMRRSLWVMLSALFCLGLGLLGGMSVVQALEPEYGGGALFFPPYPAENERFGFGLAASPGNIGGWDVSQLNAGWYLNWGSYSQPPHPHGLAYVQVIRLKGPSRPPASCMRSCTAYASTCSGATAGFPQIDYSGCQEGHPANPAAVTVSPNRTVIQQRARENPGAVWAIGNEPDRIIYMDDVCPDEYAMLYHELYHLIKAADPTAKVTVGGIVQATPIRMQYLNIIRCVYQHTYGAPLPVDLWNVHAFVLDEDPNSAGCDVPPGMVTTSLYQKRRYWQYDNMDLFDQQIRRFRRWMNDIGERNKPLIVTEYGILMPEMSGAYPLCDGEPDRNDPRCPNDNGRPYDYPRVTAYMQATFNYFRGVDPRGKDGSIGYPADGNRLVQAWNWYSLNDDWMYNGNLFTNVTKEITGFGHDFGSAAQPLKTPYRDLLPWGLSFAPIGDFYAGEAATIAISSRLFNMGTLGASHVLVQYRQDQVGGERIGDDQSASVAARYETVSPTTVVTWTGIASGTHTVYVLVDGESAFTESVTANNVISGTMAFSANLAADSLTINAVRPFIEGGQPVTVPLTAKVSNWGLVATRDVAVEFWDGDPLGGGVPVYSTTVVGPLGYGDVVTVQSNWVTDVAGWHTIYVRVDPAGKIPDVHGDDRQASGSVFIANNRLFLPSVLKGAVGAASSMSASDGGSNASLGPLVPWPTMTPTP